MPKSNRQFILREMERAQGNLEWINTHTNACLEKFAETIQELQAENQPIPDHYQAHIEFFTDLLAGVKIMFDTIQSYLDEN